jgi:hypothetical protein
MSSWLPLLPEYMVELKGEVSCQPTVTLLH